MINKKRVLGVIPAGTASTETARKNILPLAGKPLIAWTIETAQESAYIDQILLLSDDEDIIRFISVWADEVFLLTPPLMAASLPNGAESVLYALSIVPGFDYVVYLHPSSPLRTSDDIDSCLEYCEEAAVPSCITVSKAVPPPYWLCEINDEITLLPVMKGPYGYQRNEVQTAYVPNRAVYTANVKWLLDQQSFFKEGDTVGWMMPEERSIIIESDIDFIFCEWVLSKYI
ncbi:cytidylyltransferase domain-containing protein [Alteribacillus sp. HJP-4]|uniref:acylneuraminate cytidylyltransferase family protein n=1 Tax=Alteribacillus sp. HJP-4 TaxID=2775394 RepID=UPI0035CCE392